MYSIIFQNTTLKTHLLLKVGNNELAHFTTVLGGKINVELQILSSDFTFKNDLDERDSCLHFEAN